MRSGRSLHPAFGFGFLFALSENSRRLSIGYVDSFKKYLPAYKTDLHSINFYEKVSGL